MKKISVFAEAARNMERRKVFPGYGLSAVEYPCFYVCGAVGAALEHWRTEPQVVRFLGAFSDQKETTMKSQDFIANTDGLDRDVCILALCFAAAMDEAGDL